MSILKLERALAHLRIDVDIDDDVSSKLLSAEDIAQRYLNRNVYSDTDALLLAKKQVPEMVDLLKKDYSNQIDYANSLNDADLKDSLIQTAKTFYEDGLGGVNRALLGIVVNPSIEAAILLILGHLYENREDVSVVDVSELPKGATWNLNPYRIQLGV